MTQSSAELCKALARDSLGARNATTLYALYTQYLQYGMSGNAMVAFCMADSALIRMAFAWKNKSHTDIAWGST